MDDLSPFDSLPPDDLHVDDQYPPDLNLSDDDFLLDVGSLDEPGFPFDLGDGAELGLPEPADPITDLVYSEEESFEQVAQDLWDQIGPGGPLPTVPDGNPAAPPEVFAELQGHTDDPVTLSVLANGIEHWVRAQSSWGE